MTKPIIPGKILQKDFLDRFKLSRKNLAEHLKWDVKKIDRICNGQSQITPEKALAFGAAFGISVEFWLNVQRAHDLWVARQNFKAVKLLPGVIISESIDIDAEKIEIEKNIPISQPKGGVKSKFKEKYPFKDMKVEDSFFIKCENDTKKRRAIRSLLHFYCARFNKFNDYFIKIACRSLPDGFRVWRIE